MLDSEGGRREERVHGCGEMGREGREETASYLGVHFDVVYAEEERISCFEAWDDSRFPSIY